MLDESQVAAAVDLAVSEFGALDIMFNNAGIVGAVGRISEMPTEAWDNTIAILLRGVFLGTKHAARVMLEQNSGVIINTASTAGVMGGLGPHAYTAAKHGVVGLTKSVANELAPNGIRVNAIAPGNTVTAMTASVTTRRPRRSRHDQRTDRIDVAARLRRPPVRHRRCRSVSGERRCALRVGSHAGRRCRPDHCGHDAEPDEHRFEPPDPRGGTNQLTQRCRTGSAPLQPTDAARTIS